MVSFVNFAKIAILGVGFHLGTLHGYFFSQRLLAKFEFPARMSNKTCLNFSFFETGDDLIERVGIDDPVGCISVHFFGGAWGMLAVAFFAEKETQEGFSSQYGLFKGGKVILLGVQALATVSMIGWAVISTFLIVSIFLFLRFTSQSER